MPNKIKSKAEYKAMQAAAHGHSTLGIPASVGKEMVATQTHIKDLPKKVTHIHIHAK